jgi:hypothetical protein
MDQREIMDFHTQARMIIVSFFDATGNHISISEGGTH